MFAVYIDAVAEMFMFDRGVQIVVYADDIIVITSSVSKLQEAFRICQGNSESLNTFPDVYKHKSVK